MEEDFYSVGQAARILRLTDGRIRQMLRSGELEGERDHEGAPWRIPMHAVHSLREKRPGRTPPAKEALRAAESTAEGSEEVKSLIRELGRLEGRLELQEVTESTLREQLERERNRADDERARAEAERERAETLRRQLEEERSRGFWSRLFGG